MTEIKFICVFYFIALSLTSYKELDRCIVDEGNCGQRIGTKSGYSITLTVSLEVCSGAFT